MISHKIQAAFATRGKSNSYFEDFSSNQFTIKNLDDDSIQFHEIFTKKVVLPWASLIQSTILVEISSISCKYSNSKFSFWNRWVKAGQGFITIRGDKCIIVIIKVVNATTNFLPSFASIFFIMTQIFLRKESKRVELVLLGNLQFICHIATRIS